VLSLLFALALAAAPPPVPSATPHIVILGYHEVEADGLPAHETIPRGEATANTADEMQMYTVSTPTFRRQLDALAKHGYTVVPLEDVAAWLAGSKATLPERTAVITVDDGWRSVRTVLADELLRRRWPFTAFVYPRVIDRHSHHPFNLTWDEVAALARQGVDVQSHTYAHPFLSRARHADLSDAAYAEWLAGELRQSRDLIVAHTGRPVRFLAYPYGDYDAGVLAAARAAGYAAAVTVSPGAVTRTSNLLALPRYLVYHATTDAEFESWLP